MGIEANGSIFCSIVCVAEKRNPSHPKIIEAVGSVFCRRTCAGGEKYFTPLTMTAAGAIFCGIICIEKSFTPITMIAVESVFGRIQRTWNQVPPHSFACVRGLISREFSRHAKERVDLIAIVTGVIKSRRCFGRCAWITSIVADKKPDLSTEKIMETCTLIPALPSLPLRLKDLPLLSSTTYLLMPATR